MKETSRMSCSRAAHGSRPSTFNSPSYDVRPRIALSAVVLPAPFGPISPRMRPSSTRRSTLSNATVMPKTLRRPRASIVAIALALPPFCRGTALCRSGIEFLLCQAKPLNLLRDSQPFFGEKLLAFALQQQIVRAGFDEHAEASLHLDELLVDQLLISLENRERIDPILGRDIAHRRQRIPFFQHAVEYHGDDMVAKLAIDWLTVVPLTMHPVFDCCASYSVIVDYNTNSQASFFFNFFFCPPLSPRSNRLKSSASGWRHHASPPLDQRPFRRFEFDRWSQCKKTLFQTNIVTFRIACCLSLRLTDVDSRAP